VTEGYTLECGFATVSKARLKSAQAIIRPITQRRGARLQHRSTATTPLVAPLLTHRLSYVFRTPPLLRLDSFNLHSFLALGRFIHPPPPTPRTGYRASPGHSCAHLSKRRYDTVHDNDIKAHNTTRNEHIRRRIGIFQLRRTNRPRLAGPSAGYVAHGRMRTDDWRHNESQVIFF